MFFELGHCLPKFLWQWQLHLFVQVMRASSKTAPANTYSENDKSTMKARAQHLPRNIARDLPVLRGGVHRARDGQRHFDRVQRLREGNKPVAHAAID